MSSPLPPAAPAASIAASDTSRERDAVRIEVVHETIYDYRPPVESAQHMAFLRPLEDARQQVERFDMAVDPTPSFDASARDIYGNLRIVFGLASVHRRLSVTARSRVRIAPADDSGWHARSLPWEQVAAQLRYRAGAAFDPATEFAQPSPYVPRLPSLGEFAAPSLASGRPVAEAAVALMRQVHAGLAYVPDSTGIDTPLEQVLAQRRGVCQDYAHLMIGALRACGLAARYVSGYLLTADDPAAPSLLGADASHAWVAVWCPLDDGSARWLELDPTNDVLPDRGHVRLAIGRDFGDVTPLRGVIRGGGEHELTVRVRTTRVHEPLAQDLPIPP